MAAGNLAGDGITVKRRQRSRSYRNDLGPRLGIKTRPAHQDTLHLGLRHQRSHVGSVHRAAVEDPHRAGAQTEELLPDAGVHPPGIGRGGILPGPDGPDRLVRDDDPVQVVAGDAAEAGLELAGDDGRRLAALPLLQRFSHAEHRHQRRREHRAHLPPGFLVRLAEHVAALGVAHQRHRGAGRPGQWSRGGAGECALRFPVNVLYADLHIGQPAERLGRRFDADGGREEPHLAIGGRSVSSAEPSGELARLVRAEVHLPVGREQEASGHASSSAATPGSTLPSRNSSEAPPPVETWLIRSASPACATAAAESPPPTIVTAPSAVASAIAAAMTRVPPSNGGVSNTPIGPFQSTVPALLSRVANAMADAGSMSYIAKPSGTLLLGTVSVVMPSRSSGATTQPVGRTTLSPARCMRPRASSTRSSSTSDLPVARPIARKKVQAIAPPISTASTRGSSASMRSILPLTLAPPSTARKGRFGFASASPRYLSSFSIRNPATAGLSSRATPTVLAWARCAEPNASLT